MGIPIAQPITVLLQISSENPLKPSHFTLRNTIETIEFHAVVAVRTLIRLKGISAEFQVIRGFSQKIPADLLSYDKIHS